MSEIDEINKAFASKYDGRIHAADVDSCLFLSGELDSWEDIVAAGQLAVTMRKEGTKNFIAHLQNEQGERPGGVVNDIQLKGRERFPKPFMPGLKDNALDGLKPDVLVIGAGISGTAITRELSRNKISVLLIDKEHDIAMQATSRNDGMVHPGIDLSKHSWKYHYNHPGNAMYGDVAKELGVKFARPGQYIGITDEKQIPELYASMKQWEYLGVPGAEVVLDPELHKREPGIRKEVIGGIFFPSTGEVCPYGMAIGYAENAVQNGAQVSLDTVCLGMELTANHVNHANNTQIVSVRTNRGTIYPQVVVNAAGVFAEEIATMAGDRFYSIHPRRGTNSILDKKYSDKIIKTAAALIGNEDTERHSKGGGLIRTVHKNVLVGPNAIETNERESYATEPNSIEKIFEKFYHTSEEVTEDKIIAYFTGVRAPTYEEDFVVCKGRRCANMVHAAGIQSPGLTAAPAIALDVARFSVELLEGQGMKVEKKEDFNPIRKKIPELAEMSPEERDALIKKNPDYGVIVCRCEEISRGEIIDSLHGLIPCDTVDGVKRRVRPGMGRCQGGFCGPIVTKIISEELGIPLDEVSKKGKGSEILCGVTK
ncbi:MAG: FAD-dependent oxidoreductase [Spirochaetaceae bacterium]|jgi:glycerol-3-phosphate dehydrogenase|nr:FAD-dependent oxidoreductase [Spirochaetaceae bacterium]